MIGRKFIEWKKQELKIKEYMRTKFGKGRVSDIKIERTPVGEKVIIFTTKPGLVIGKRGETIEEVSKILKNKFGLENPQIDVSEITEPFFDAQTVADNIASSLERFGPLGFKIVAYRELDRITRAGALGAEIVLSGKLPGERARSWRFAYGYLKKTGGSKDIVKIAKATAETMPGTVGVKVSIVPKYTIIPDKIDISAIKEEIEEKLSEAEEEAEKEKREGEEKQEALKEEKKKVKKRGRKPGKKKTKTERTKKK